MSDDLVRRLRRIKEESGRSLREIERATHISNSTLSRYLAGQSTPSWNAVVAVCGAVGADPRPLRPLWVDAQRARRAPGRPFDVDRSAVRRGTPRNDLPRDTAAFTARHEELATTLRLARAGRAVAIDGMGGVGKTALAVHAAHRLAAQFPDGRHYVDLHGFTPGRDPLDPAEALLILLRALGLPGDRIPAGLEERAALWRSELAERRALVLLDNALDATHVRPLLPGAGTHAVLVTSRRRLVDLEGVEPLSLTPLSLTEAAELFSATLGGVAADPRTAAAAPAEAASINELMHRLGGLPLAVRIAAARLRHRPSWSVANLLEHSPVDDAGFGQVVAASLARLDEPQRRMFRLLGLFPGTVVEPLAASALADLPPVEAGRLLDDLVDANLLEEPRAKRYRFHDLVRQAAQECARPGDRDAALDRLADFYLHVLNQGRRALEYTVDHVLPVARIPTAVPDFGDPGRVTAWYDEEAATIGRMVELMVERGRDDLTVQFAIVIGAFLSRRGEMRRWHEVADAGVRAAERRGVLDELAAVTYFRGVAGLLMGRLDAAEADFSAVHALASRSGDVGMRILTLRRLAAIAQDRGDFRRALEVGRRVRAEPDAARYPLHLAFSEILTARSLITLGRPAEAARIARDVLAGPEAADPVLRINSLRLLGQARLAMEDPRGALETFLDAAAVSRETSHSSYVALCRGDSAEALSRLGRHVEALDEHEAAVASAADSGQIHREAYLRQSFGRTCLAAGDLDRAADQFRRCLALAEPRGLRYVAALARLGLADAAESAADAEELRAEGLAALRGLGVEEPARLR